MKLKHRKLFPNNGTTTNCSDFCDEPFGNFYYPQPPPPPSPSSLSVSDQNDGLSSSVVVLLAVLGSLILLLLLCYVVVSKSCLGLFRRGRTRDNYLISAQSVQSERDQFVDLHHQNPIWLIATVGLQQPIINSITAVRYRKDEGLIDGSDCSVCLSEFREGDALRLLPKCSHAFHVSCIDTWLRSHTNCPLCRAHIVAEPPDPTNNNNIATGMIVSSSDAAVDEAATYSEAVAEENDVVRSALRRSVSMGNNNRTREEKFARMIRVSPVAMKKRSLSCGGRFFSRQSNDHDHQLTRL